MSQRDEKDLFQSEKTGQCYSTEKRMGRKKNKVSDAMQSEGKSGGGRMMCTA